MTNMEKTIRGFNKDHCNNLPIPMEHILFTSINGTQFYIKQVLNRETVKTYPQGYKLLVVLIPDNADARAGVNYNYTDIIIPAQITHEGLRLNNRHERLKEEPIKTLTEFILGSEDIITGTSFTSDLQNRSWQFYEVGIYIDTVLSKQEIMNQLLRI